MARAEVRHVLKNSKSPLAVLVELANDDSKDAALRVQAASAALPFMMPRLSAAVTADVSKAMDRPATESLLRKLSDQFAKLADPSPTIDMLPAPILEAETVSE